MLRNSSRDWGRLSRGFHWTIVALVAIQVPVGFWMVEVYETYTETYADDTWVMRTSLIHHTGGFLILILATFRLTWRVSNPTPDLPPGLVAYRRFLARLTHIFLYVLMFVYPLTGWAALSAYDGEFPIFFFAWDAVPGIVPRVPEGAPFDYPFFAEIHRLGWKVGGVILGLHVTAALWHHYVARDHVLRRMLRGSTS